MKIVLDNIYKSYKKGAQEIPVLKGFSKVLNSNMMYLVKGPSGAGKTTLLSIVGLLDSPTSGQVFIDDDRVDHLKERDLCTIRRERFGFVFQDYGLLENLTVYENISLACQELPNMDECIQQIEDILTKLNLGHRIHHKVSELSGGEKQRTSFARAMIKNPDILICDEPLSNIDENNAKNVAQILLEAKKDRIIIVSCHTRDLDTLCDEQIVLG